MRLSGPQRRSGRFREYKNLLPLPRFELQTVQSFMISCSIGSSDYATFSYEYKGSTYILTYGTDDKYTTEVGNREGVRCTYMGG
jgi:hypothetical protein